jgi:hypothetical protein|tara:strand:- start:253 stop:354 length:102 start_codon:yes stop_codon:yes gene_type:complete
MAPVKPALKLVRAAANQKLQQPQNKEENGRTLI